MNVNSHSFFPWRREAHWASPWPKALRPVPSYEKSRKQTTEKKTKKQIHAPTGKQRSVPGATSGVLPTLRKVGHQVQKGQHPCHGEEGFTLSSRTSWAEGGHQAGLAPALSCGDAGPMEEKKGPVSRTTQLLPLLSVQPLGVSSSSPGSVKSQKNDICETLPKYRPGNQLLASAASPLCGNSRVASV